MTIGAAALAGPVVLSGCAASPAQHRPVGMANPASVSCIRQGGHLTTVNTPSGEIGMCRLPDGRECEEWALFRDHRCVAAPR
nr:DUF333 domain-containing protein [Neoasaia chiangmaiensis]